MIIWACVTNDAYELIELWELSADILAEKLGTKRDSIYKAYKRNSVLFGAYRVRKIILDDGGNEDED